MKRFRVRLPRPSEEKILTAGFFGGLAIVALAIALIYFPLGLLVAGGSCSVVCAKLARSPEDDE